jgi:anti-sigma B factor antagonist
LIESIGGQVSAQFMEPFQCEVSMNGDRVVVAPRGELDMATVPRLDHELERHTPDGSGGTLVLDLRALTFMDSSGLHLTARWAMESSKDGFAFEIVPGPPPIQRVFELARMTAQLPFKEPG